MLSQYTPLDSMLTVVDAVTALAELQSEDLLATRGLAAQEGDQRAIASLMVQQIECADTCAFPLRVGAPVRLIPSLNTLPSPPLQHMQCW